MHFPFVSSIALCVPSLCISIHNFIFTCMSTLIFTGGPIESSAAAAAALINLIVIVIAAISSCSSLGDFTSPLPFTIRDFFYHMISSIARARAKAAEVC
ncbi:hypothetical protein NC652_032034 [Populus alba x Populus x berolinensis]|nr:hypothetical protein NC652_032034 [Populus alba x Populus x berolinensis]